MTPLERRVPVPSDRERELGLGSPSPDGVATAAPSPDGDAGPTPARRGFHLVRYFRSLIRDMNPWKAVAGHDTKPLVIMSASNVLQGVAIGAITANFLTIRRDLGITDDTLILVGTLFSFVGAASGPVIGYVADRVPRIAVAAVGTAIFGITTLLLGVWGSLFALVVAQISQTVFADLGPVKTAYELPLVADYYPPEVRGRVWSTIASIGTLGDIPGAIVGGILGVVLGWQVAIGTTGALAMGAALLWLSLREPPRGRWDRLHLGASEEVASLAHRPPSFAESFRAAAAIRTLRRIWYAEIFLGAGGLVLLPLLLLILGRVVGISPAVVGVVVAIQKLATVAGLATGGAMVDRILADRPGRVMVAIGVTFIFNMAALLALALFANPVVGLVLLVLQPFVSMLPVAGREVLMSQVVPARLRSFGLQINKVFGLLGALALPVALAVSTGDPVRAALFFAFPVMGIGVVIYLTASVDVERDIEAARHAALAEEEMFQSKKGDRAKLLIARQVDVHYDGVQVLFGVDFEVEEGELVALLGTNGAGKSTLLRAISGLTQPTGGAVFLDGRDVTHAPAHELARFGVVQMPGGKGVFPAMSVLDNLRAAAWVEPERFEERLERVLELFPNLRERLHQAAGSLSGGEQQMVSLAQAFVMRPKLLLIDELSLGLAPTVVEQLLQAVEAIHEQGTAIILVEQSVNLALTVADRAVFMEKGEVRFSGPAEELVRRPEIVRSVYLKGTTQSGPAAPRAREPVTGDAGAATEVRAVVLDVDDVHVSYGGVKALRGASVDVAAGEIVGVLGPNGAGKTTLFDAISGFVEIEAGRIAVAGKDVTGLPPDQRARLGLGRSFQDARLFPSLTVAENIAVAMERHTAASRSAALSALWLPQVRRTERKLAARADGLVELLGLGDYRDKFVSELSTGSRRIVDLACEMAADPDVLILDEPSSGIAQAEAEELGPLLDRVRRELGCGLLVIEHDMRLLTSIADRLVGMVLGEVVVSGSATEVTEHPILVEAYLGTSERAVARSGTVPTGGRP